MPHLDNVLSRYLFYSSEFNRNTRFVSTSVFSRKQEKGFSIFDTTDLCHLDNWELARSYATESYARQGRPLLGRFDTQTRNYINADLRVTGDMPPPRHYIVMGMPVNADNTGLPLSKRQVLASKCILHLISDDVEWEKCL